MISDGVALLLKTVLLLFSESLENSCGKCLLDILDGGCLCNFKTTHDFLKFLLLLLWPLNITFRLVLA